MKSQVMVRDDRPFSSVKGQVPHFKGLKGRRTVTYRNSLYSDDLDDPELVFDNNNTFSRKLMFLAILLFYGPLLTFHPIQTPQTLQ